jgi:type I restriction-modification system DNA methylase subunit
MVDARLAKVQESLNALEKNRDLASAKQVVRNVSALLLPGLSEDTESLFRLFNDQDGKLKANSSWFFSDTIITDKLATYTLETPAESNLDIKVYGVKKAKKGTISWVVGLTPNFEDEPFNSKFNVGIDFIIPESLDRVIVALSKNYVIRTLELKGQLTATFQEILNSWLGITDLSRKVEFHNILWNSLDLSPINKKFYEGISQRFISLRQHIETSGALDHDHAAQFANRLIGRVIFTWFLDKKSLIEPSLKYFDSEDFGDDTDYYRQKLEPLFFDVLNTPVSDRKGPDVSTPYLNGGLFESKPGDLFQDLALSFPKNYFDDFFAFLRSYNFTTDESTTEFQQVAIDPEMLGRIFENLLAEVNEDTGDQARKAKGAFYTPRRIVDFMCRESLKGYLESRFPEDSNFNQRLHYLIDARERDFQDQDHNWRGLLKPYKAGLLEALDDLRVLDPACGSGAFPIGMMQLLLQVYGRLDPRLDHYRTKLSVIEKNIYGADREPMAVEISRLRVWLALVVDQDSVKSGISPLPNLDFKFVCANSLIGLDKDSKISLFEDKNLDIKLQELRDAFFATGSAKVKADLRLRYSKLVSEESILGGDTARTVQLKSFRPFEPDKVSSFFDPLEMFGVEHFDVVIGNPPYVSVKAIPTSEKTQYSRIFETGQGRFNLFTLFIELGQKLLTKNGQLFYIIPEGIFSHAEYRHIRTYLTNNCTIRLAVLFSQRVFEAAVDTTILGIQNGSSARKMRVNRDLVQELGEIDQQDLQQGTDRVFPVRVFGRDKTFSDAVEKTGKNSFFDFFDIQQGIIYSGQSREDVFSNEKTSKEFKPILDGRDIHRFKINWASKKEARYLRYTKELHRPRDEGIFLARPKIVMPRRSPKLICAVDQSQFYVLNTAYVFVPKSGIDPYFFAALINSKVLNQYYSLHVFGWQITLPSLTNLPVARGSEQMESRISDLCKRIHNDHFEGKGVGLISEMEHELEVLVMDLYEIPETERPRLLEVP